MLLSLIILAAPAVDLNPPRVSHEPPKAADGQARWHLWFEVRDESALFGAALYLATPDGGWKSVTPKEVAPGWLEVVLPAVAGTRYFFEVFDVQGNGPTRVGSAEAPFVLTEPVGTLPAARPWEKKLVEPVPAVTRPWWQRRPPDHVLIRLGAAAALGGVVYGAWALLRKHPVAKVTLVPVGTGVLP